MIIDGSLRYGRLAVTYDPGASKEATRLRGGLRRGQIPSPNRQMGGTQSVGELDLVR